MITYTKAQLAAAAKAINSFIASPQGLDMIDSVRSNFNFGSMDVRKQAVYVMTGKVSEQKLTRFNKPYLDFEFDALAREVKIWQPSFVLEKSLLYTENESDTPDKHITFLAHLQKGTVTPQYVCKHFIHDMTNGHPVFYIYAYNQEKIASHFGHAPEEVSKLFRTHASKRTDVQLDHMADYKEWVRTQPPKTVLKPEYAKVYKKNVDELPDPLYKLLVGKTVLMHVK